MNQPMAERAKQNLDYFEVETRSGVWQVSTAMAKHIEAALDATPAAVWVTFVDLNGARVRVRTETIVSIAHTTIEQRATSRTRHRLLQAEHEMEGTGND